MQAQKKKLSKRKRRGRDFALCGARQELRALDSAAFPPKRRAKTLLRVEIFVSEIFGLPFLAIHQNGLDKNAQSRRISVSSPYKRTAETDFGERKSEYNKNAGNPRADFLPSLKSILVKNLSSQKCLLLKKLLTPFTFSICTFLAIHQNGLDKNAQNRRISVSSPYNCMAETDFGERKSEYNKNAGNPRADFLPSLKPISVKV